MTIDNEKSWDAFISEEPSIHILQTTEWGLLKQKHGWYSKHLIFSQTGAQILFKKFPLGLRLAYIPKGPVGEFTDAFFSKAIAFCRQERAFVLYVEPDSWDNEIGGNLRVLKNAGFFQSTMSIQPRRTVVISLLGSEEDWLSRMKQKTRYNIRLALKKGVVVEESLNIEVFNELMKVTGTRDQFGVHSKEYYQDVFALFSRKGQCKLLIAQYQDIPLAGIMVFAYGNRAWYFYGASNNRERNRMPTYLLQWEAMKWAAAQGCTKYDLWGIPDEDVGILESEFTARSDGLWGVYRFKRGFGGEIKRTSGVYEQVLNKQQFWFYSLLLKMKQRAIN